VPSGGGVVAEVNGTPILASELDEKVSGRLARLRQEEFEIRQQALEELVAERLLAAEAAKRRLTREELLRREVEAKLTMPTANAVETLYQQNQGRFAGQTKEQALARIRQLLEDRARSERRSGFEKELRRAAQVDFRLEPPRTPLELPADVPSTGSARAPITMVEFTDYQCPYCHRAESVVEELLSRYAGKLRLVHLDFPLEGHPGALPAARAARCAGEQGRFWDYHRDLMTSGGLLDETDLKARAARLGLKAGPFAACLASGRYDAAIRASVDRGVSLGVNGTPAYFINGRMVSGARPIEDFAKIIDSELEAGS
jgi:protein-disulfide isomerase